MCPHFDKSSQKCGLLKKDEWYNTTQNPMNPMASHLKEHFLTLCNSASEWKECGQLKLSKSKDPPKR